MRAPAFRRVTHLRPGRDVRRAVPPSRAFDRCRIDDLARSVKAAGGALAVPHRPSMGTGCVPLQVIEMDSCFPSTGKGASTAIRCGRMA